MGKKSNSLFTFLSGVALGAVVGLLYAPEEGSETREKLSFRLKKYKQMLKNFIDDLIEEKANPLTNQAKFQGTKVVNEAKNKAERLLEDVDELLSRIQKKP